MVAMVAMVVMVMVVMMVVIVVMVMVVVGGNGGGGGIGQCKNLHFFVVAMVSLVRKTSLMTLLYQHMQPQISILSWNTHTTFMHAHTYICMQVHTRTTCMHTHTYVCKYIHALHACTHIPLHEKYGYLGWR